MPEPVIPYNGKIVEQLVLKGDIASMTPAQKVDYYNWLCNSLGLNPATQPFEIIRFQGKEKLYAKKDATDQLRSIHEVSVIDQKIDDTFKDKDVYIVQVTVKDATGRTDTGTGAVSVKGLGGEALCNAIMKAETKAKRRGTLSICGLGMLDESERDTMPEHTTMPIPAITKEPKTQEVPLATRNYTNEVMAISSIPDLEAYWKALSAQEKSDYKGLVKERKEAILSAQEPPAEVKPTETPSKKKEAMVEAKYVEVPAVEDLINGLTPSLTFHLNVKK